MHSMTSKPHQFRIPDDIAALIRGMHPHLKKKIKGSLHAIMAEPHSGKLLKEALPGLRSFQVSRLRIIYRISKKQQIEVVATGPREQIYYETYRIIAREEKKG
ncbi:MAG: type II toxin-antitoxin system RelE/ParE family toxin [Deltaproteobacteria bacterium]|nr:type II toxin-antitoxin system RelE/ParE family toxin [Deltaproteobacteria bacterium]